MVSDPGWKYVEECGHELYFVDEENFVFVLCQVCGSDVYKSIKTGKYFWTCNHKPKRW